MTKAVNEAVASEPSSKFYEGYESWKGWTEPFKFTAEEASYFAGETSCAKIADADVLEIGFGSGSFVAWARDQGARIAGTEINPVLLSAARAFGVELLEADLETVADSHADRFDTIVAFDVFEHFTLDAVMSRLAAAETMLKPGGRLIMRFPNGQSPFGLTAQNGDPTHVTPLSRDVVEQLTRATRLEVVRYSPSFRIAGGGIAKSLARRLRYAARDVMSLCLNAIYSQNIPWDAVVVLVLRKR
jgi:2-polyprenyl-3-methyl-5-hydroxy-6-metoxy-1,4-benzoquinol methylase